MARTASQLQLFTLHYGTLWDNWNIKYVVVIMPVTAMVCKCDCMEYLVSNTGCEGTSLFTVITEELTGSPETSKNLSLSVSKELSALMYSFCHKGNATEYCTE